ncbi:galactosylceramide sulfotransferase-like [Glandiceps talaboti]
MPCLAAVTELALEPIVFIWPANTEGMYSRQYEYSRKDPCKPKNNFVFIKTDKTGGSTIANIFFRYGLQKNLVAALDPNRSFAIDYNSTLQKFNILQYNCTDFPGYNLMANHVVYHRSAMDNVVKNAKYITIFRSAESHVKSRYYYYGRFKGLQFSNSSNPLFEYLKAIEARYARKTDVVYPMSLNTQIRRFGIQEQDPDSVIDERIKQLDSELDLVMLTEYFDESLVLLKKMMCWDFEDVVYHSFKVHTKEQPPITPEMRNIMQTLVRPDIKLYEHFNNTFWDNVRNYDGDFTADLIQFRSIQRKISLECEEELDSDYCKLLYTDDVPMVNAMFEKQLKWIC